ncbi:hypothetical protein [Cohnella sp. REN36]|uniref:hypothetical protein n=1 Tax=Cohnella sp. REN36 TaxID=2887347 RepID=UPI001D15D23A|nr:hypothetical protein [Cohnella sp. REN36]MCC3375080.1 hypothetical protein [Cohnella sp. REN36]
MSRKSVLGMVGALVVGVAVGVAIMLNNQAYDSVKEALGQQTTQNAVGGVGLGGISAVQLSSMDIETALAAVQSQRAQLVDQQLTQQLKDVQARNDEIAKLNLLLSELNLLRGGKSPYVLTADQQTRLNAAGVAANASNRSYDASQLDGFIQALKSKLDSLGNSQQMDMLRLQSLTNKRNEAFDIMTNFIQKMQDSRSSIIGNMR